MGKQGRFGKFVWLWRQLPRRPLIYVTVVRVRTALVGTGALGRYIGTSVAEHRCRRMLQLRYTDMRNSLIATVHRRLRLVLRLVISHSLCKRKGCPSANSYRSLGLRPDINDGNDLYFISIRTIYLPWPFSFLFSRYRSRCVIAIISETNEFD